MVSPLSGCIFIKEINYLNFSVNVGSVGLAPVGLIVSHQIDTLGPLSGHPGSIPGWSGPQ